jgi:hypothetical protein
MGAVGIDGAGDMHLAKGVHLRVFTAPDVGLPIRPFLVYRLNGDEAQRHLASAIRTAFVWVDSTGRVLTLPFEVTPRNPVTGYIVRPPGVRAIAVMVVVQNVDRPQGVAMDAFIDTPQGRRVIGRRDSALHALAAPEIHGVVLSGSGTVRTAIWVADDVSIVEKLQPIMQLDLPVPAAARYEGLPDARNRAEKRVRIGAPARLGLHDDPSVAGPAAAAPATDNDEWARVEPLAREIEPHLAQVLNDLSARPATLARPQTLTDGVRSTAFAEALIPSLRAVLSATADPGVAKWLGFSAVDDDPVALSTPLTIYYLRGFVAIDREGLDLAELLSLNFAGGELTADLSSPLLPFKVPMTSADRFPVFDFTVPVIVFPGVPPARPPAPAVGMPRAPAVLIAPLGAAPPATADGQGPWLAEFVPPEARREVVLPLADLTAAPSLAVARLEGATLFPLNERHPVSGRALALIPAVPQNALITGTGEVSDRTVPPDPVRYRVAQADWFGRWSEWTERPIAAKTRALPPAPVIDAHYVLASATPVDNTPRFGTLSVRVRVPRPEDLAPGARLLVSARIEAVIGGVTVTVAEAVTSPTQGVLDIVVSPPAGVIARAGSVEAVITARWNDGTTDGPASEPLLRTLVDPRPPAALVLDPTLRYSARPDAVGRSRMVLDWTAAPGVRYRVYTTDETRLRGVLGERADGGNALAQALLDDLAAAPTPAHRGQAYTAAGREGLYTRDLFTNLTAEPLAPAAGPTRFSHDLSGSLTVLAFFKIVAVSGDNVESPFTEATLLPIGVPSGGPPPRPLLDMLGYTDEGHAQLRVTAVRGPQPAARWRLRRSVAASADPLRMPIVAEGTVPEAPADGPTVFEIVDAGLDALAGGSLRPWTRMSWRVEVQAGSPPGSTIPGEWSPASGPVGNMHVPPAPAAATDLAVESVVGDVVTLTWRHPDPLTKGSQGGYRFDLYRREPESRETLVVFALADDPTVATGSGPTRTFRVADAGPTAPGTTWRVVTLDPAGRLSAPSAAVARP